VYKENDRPNSTGRVNSQVTRPQALTNLKQTRQVAPERLLEGATAELGVPINKAIIRRFIQD
jgi:hypothetical protein